MSIERNPDEHEALAESFSRRHARMTARERVSELAADAGFIAAVAALWAVQPPHGLSIEPALVCTLVLALATLVPFESPLGFTVPTQLAFVPLLFSMPVALTPIATVIALTLGQIPAVVSRQLNPTRLPLFIGNAWFAVGPAAVFALTGVAPQRAGPAILIAALGAQFLIDLVVSTLRLLVMRGASLADQLRESWIYGVDVALSGVGLEVAKNVHSAPLAALTLVPLLGLLSVFARERHQRLESLLELNNAYRGTALVLGDVIEADDGYTGEHSKGVVALAMAVADNRQLNARQRRNLEFAALLHDVGKIAIPKEIINKPGKLDEHEWKLIKTHTVEGQRMLDNVGGFMREVGLIVRSHHERWDGAGYPDGLAGSAIPLEARIIACCDTWNAMRTDRSYRKALPHDVALAELTAGAGSQFDPELVRVLVEIVDASGAAQAPAQPVAAPTPRSAPGPRPYAQPIAP